MTLLMDPDPIGAPDSRRSLPHRDPLPRDHQFPKRRKIHFTCLPYGIPFNGGLRRLVRPASPAPHFSPVRPPAAPLPPPSAPPTETNRLREESTSCLLLRIACDTFSAWLGMILLMDPADPIGVPDSKRSLQHRDPLPRDHQPPKRRPCMERHAKRK